jgi:NAD(P) transhydrogenase
MTQAHYDLIVIGSGPGGEGAAMKAMKHGRRVLIVDDNPELGGNCTHRGTIPSKALRHAVQNAQQADVHQTYQVLLQSAENVIARQVKMRTGFYKRNQIDVMHGKAVFQDQNSLLLRLGSHESQYSSESFVIASGSRPHLPTQVDFSHPRILNSDSVLSLQTHPRSITIYGAGVIGCEYASIFRGLGVKVNLINTRDKLLAFLDDEIIDALSYHMREQGVVIRHNESCERVEATDKGVTIYLDSHKQIHSDVLLWAQGRQGNSDNMGLEDIGVEVDSRGNIVVNSDYQTNIAHIYAVGDVVGYPSLASAAYDQGRFAATHQVFGECEHSLVEHIPTGIYVIPEISSVGLNERELTRDKVPYEVGYASFKDLARAQITGHLTGMLKLLFHRETLEILGIHCFGYQASEIVHIGQAIMTQQGEANTVMYFVNTTFNYPTMAEAYRVAALNGLNRIAGH